MNVDELKYSLGNLVHRKLRSFLSALSILIGIAAIFTLVSFGLGLQNYITTLAEEAGTDKLFIQAKGIGAPGTDENFFLTADDINFIKRINGINEAEGISIKAGEVMFREETVYAFVSGYDEGNRDFIEEAFTVKIDEGRGFKSGELGKVILGHNYKVKDKLFSRPLETGDIVQINGQDFKVAGFYEEVGNPHDDSNVYLTDDAFELLFPDTKDKFGFVMASADSGVETGPLALKVKDKLRKFKGQEEGKEDFFVQTFEDALQVFTNIFLVINGILVLIACISLIVATVNIMNSMYAAVLERTSEIGVMKAIGAENSTIMQLFVVESGLLALVGGAFGIVFGYILASAGGAAAAAAGYSFLKPIFPLWLIIFCLVFSFVVGALAGLLPARQASKLQPVEALRYE